MLKSLQLYKVKVEHFSESFYKPFSLYESNMIDHIIRGMIKSHAQSEDVHVIGDMTNKMFMNSSSGMGLDLVSQVGIAFEQLNL